MVVPSFIKKPVLTVPSNCIQRLAPKVPEKVAAVPMLSVPVPILRYPSELIARIPEIVVDELAARVTPPFPEPALSRVRLLKVVVPEMVWLAPEVWLLNTTVPVEAVKVPELLQLAPVPLGPVRKMLRPAWAFKLHPEPMLNVPCTVISIPAGRVRLLPPVNERL